MFILSCLRHLSSFNNIQFRKNLRRKWHIVVCVSVLYSLFVLFLLTVTAQVLYLQRDTCHTVVCTNIDLTRTLANVLSREEQLPDSCICIQSQLLKSSVCMAGYAGERYSFSYILNFSEGASLSEYFS